MGDLGCRLSTRGIHESRSGQGSHQRRSFRASAGDLLHGWPRAERRSPSSTSRMRWPPGRQMHSAASRATTTATSPANRTGGRRVQAAATRMGGLNLRGLPARALQPPASSVVTGRSPSPPSSGCSPINTLGTFLPDRAAAAIMQTNNAPEADGERGLLIPHGLVAAFEGQIGQVAYATSKPRSPAWCCRSRASSRDSASASWASHLESSAPDDGGPAAGSTGLARKAGAYSRRASAGLRNTRDLVAAIVTNRMLNGETIRIDGADPHGS